MFHYTCDFDLQECIKNMGLEEKGRVQSIVTDEVLRLSDDYVPFSEGTLKASGMIDPNDETVIVWNTPYARYMWNGILYVDPLTKSSFARKDVMKVPAKPEKKLKYHNGSNRSDHWVERMMQNGGREKVEKAARKGAGR